MLQGFRIYGINMCVFPITEVVYFMYLLFNGKIVIYF